MKRVTVILITTLILINIVGCQTSSNKPLTQDQNQTNNLQSQVDNNQNQVIVDKFKNLAEQVSGVKKAYVAISTPNVSNNNGIGTINTNPDYNTPGTTTNTNTDINTKNNIIKRDPLGMNEINNNTNNLPTYNPPSPSSTSNITSTANNMVVMVGLKLDSTNNNSNMSNIEKMVENKIKNADSRVTQVLVTTDSGMISEINSINNSIKNGTSVQSIQTSINNLTRKLTTNQ